MIDDAVALLLLRLAASACLLLFVGMVGLMLWRDFQQATVTSIGQMHRTGRLIVVRSDNPDVSVGRRWSLLPITTIGRATTNTITLNETFVSNEHALITWRGGRWWLEDLNSSNGTLLNDETLEEPTVLSTGDVIGVGRIRARVEVD